MDKHDPSNRVAKKKLLDRRRVLSGGAVGAIGALAMPSVVRADKREVDDLAGLWRDVVSASDNSFPAFPIFELFGAGIYIGSGQPDLQPQSLSSSAWGIWERVGLHRLRLTIRYWTYDAHANPTGFGASTGNVRITLNKDGNSYSGEGALQFFDNNGNPVGPPTPALLQATRITFS